MTVNTSTTLCSSVPLGDHYITPSPDLLQVLLAHVNGKGSVPKLRPKAERVKLETALVQPLQDCAVMNRAHLSVVYCIMNVRYLCVRV